MKIGIIGFGRFGKLVTEHLAKEFEVHVFNRSNKDEEIKNANAVPATIEGVCKTDIVILCMPISELENILHEIRDMLEEDSLVVDVCSVKKYPVDIMKKILPGKVQILATHPMFGPDSAASSLENMKIVLCKARIPEDKYNKIKGFLGKKGLSIIETTPEKHDKETAESLILAHFIGRSLMEFGAREHALDTECYKRLLGALEIVKHDTWQLFEDMNKYNSYAKKMRKSLIEALNKIERRVEE